MGRQSPRLHRAVASSADHWISVALRNSNAFFGNGSARATMSSGALESTIFWYTKGASQNCYFKQDTPISIRGHSSPAWHAYQVSLLISWGTGVITHRLKKSRIYLQSHSQQFSSFQPEAHCPLSINFKEGRLYLLFVEGRLSFHSRGRRWQMISTSSISSPSANPGLNWSLFCSLRPSGKKNRLW